ncbi:MAG: hypothetical protein CFE43_19450 [Burkholderiales bacterium PBB3]|nr:MAG: hypothetical protein CFE43_19450 [Burkholderiales bacterium PBB3]
MAFASPAAMAQAQVSAKPETLATASKAPDCTPQTQVDVGKITQQIVLIGESHGTKELPEFTSGLVCSLLKDGRSVILALERFAEEHEHLQRYIESEGTASDKSALLGVHMWASRWQDGRSSEAMFALVEDIRKLRKSGQRVGILAMQKLDSLQVPMTDAERAPLSFADNNIYNILNDRAMADSLLSAAVLYRNYTIVGLAGALHVSTIKGNKRDPNYTPMAYVLNPMQPTFIIGVRQGGGEFWGLKASYDIYQFRAGDFFGEVDKVDAIVHFPKLTASPSANPAAAALARKPR